MKTAIVTGTSSGIGLSIAELLLKNGYGVYGIARSPSHPLTPFWKEYHPVVLDLLDSSALLAWCETFKKAEKNLNLLVNNAGIGNFGPHETLRPEKIQKMLRLNLEVPLILCQQFLRSLKESQGHIINIASVTARKSSPQGCAYAASKAGLTQFSHSLFEENRKSGLKVTSILPDMTQTDFFHEQNFTTAEDPNCYLRPEQIAQTVLWVLEQEDNLTIEEILLRPQKNQIKRK